MVKKLVVLSVLLMILSIPVTAYAQADSPLPPPAPDPQPGPGGTDLSSVLLWVAFGGGAGIVAYWAVGQVRQPEWSSKQTRFVALALTVAVAAGAYGLAVVFGYEPDPGGGRAWVEQLFQVCFAAVLMSQSIHGARDL